VALRRRLAGQPKEYRGTRFALFLKRCFVRSWAGRLHPAQEPDAVTAVVQGERSATDSLFTCCDGKLTDEDLTDEGNADRSTLAT
jgi:hypothetical protein